ncbi:hypothetical protein FEE95_16040 [Maribacter algarum]|uniref:Uncharacterized protein n=1 Tax=Maribacter algarum (ex Zhang et al. 2020) TaxID=2578118 RepID=A0A5S3QFS4_9FLAO|nr:hypothetical protein [Maribacter algarum]TMM56137.1 hypothetical protein FEE95_16040 [Maribacter algarum]
MSKLNHILISRKLFFGLLVLLIQVVGHSQEETVIDNKGTLITVRNNVVTTAAIAPTNPIEDDIWFDTTVGETKVYDGTVWKDIAHIGTTGSIFFAGTDGTPTEDNSQLFWDNTNNRLGVGTNSPTNKLEVAGATLTQGVLNSNGTAGDPSYRFSNDINTGLFRPAADEIGFSVGGIEAMNIDETAGNTTVIINETIDLGGQLLDENDSAGTVGQVLTATATGTEWTSNINPIKAIGKVSAGGVAIRMTTGVTVNRLSRGYYRITLPAGLVSDANYIIQVSQLGRGGAGNDDPGISYNNQNTTFFDVIIGDNDNGGSDRARFDGEFMFTILDL